MKKLTLIILFASFLSSLNAQIEKQDTIKSNAETKKFIDPIYGTPIPNPKNKSSTFTNGINTPGDYLMLSGYLRLSGIGLSVTTYTLFAVGVFDDMTLKKKTTVAIVSGMVNLSLFIGSEFCLIKAGKIMNEERVTLSPASEGIDLAISF